MIEPDSFLEFVEFLGERSAWAAAEPASAIKIAITRGTLIFMLVSIKSIDGTNLADHNLWFYQLIGRIHMTRRRFCGFSPPARFQGHAYLHSYAASEQQE